MRLSCGICIVCKVIDHNQYLYSKIKTGIVVLKFKKPDKQLDARVDNKKWLHLDRKALPILQSIKIKSERHYMLIGMKNEGWTKSGVKAAGWMSKHVLWNKPTLHASVADINKKLKFKCQNEINISLDIYISQWINYVPSAIVHHTYLYYNTYKIKLDTVLKQLSAHCFIYNCHMLQTMNYLLLLLSRM